MCGSTSGPWGDVFKAIEHNAVTNKANKTYEERKRWEHASNPLMCQRSKRVCVNTVVLKLIDTYEVADTGTSTGEATGTGAGAGTGTGAGAGNLDGDVRAGGGDVEVDWVWQAVGAFENFPSGIRHQGVAPQVRFDRSVPCVH